MLVPPLCWSCGAAARRGEPLCRCCRARLQRVGKAPVLLCGVRVWAPLAYTGPARDLVRALKFSRATRVADAMAAQIAANAPSGLLASELVPVPLHPKRLRTRGFNQAAVIAGALSHRTGLSVTDCLARTGSAATQVGRHRRQRRAGPAGRVELTGAAPRRAVLVDDVATTGATLAACAAALRSGGCEEVVAVTFARTVGR
jgi:ComF family protein